MIDLLYLTWKFLTLYHMKKNIYKLNTSKIMTSFWTFQQYFASFNQKLRPLVE